MAGKAEEVMEGIKDITECCICTEMFTDPRMLPCIHTFCLLCLEKTGSESQKKPGDKMPCPLCRQEFIIPTEGLRGVQKNFFMERLIEMAKLSQPPDIIRYCDSCNSGQIENTTETPLAKMYCIECEENLCDDCTNYHKNQKQLKMHQVVAFGNQTLIGKLIKRAASNNCDHHTKYSIEMYCHDCQRAICMKCFAIDHKGHRSSDVEDVAEKFRRQIEVDIEKVKTSYADGLKIRAQVDVEKINYIKQVETAETEIIKRANELKDLVDKNMQSLLAQLVSRKAETLKTLQIERDEINMHLRILDSFKTYCSKIQDKGTPGDICRVVDDLCGQSSELERKHKSFTERPMSSFSVTFEKTNLEGLLSERNIIGTVKGTKEIYLIKTVPGTKEIDLMKTVPVRTIKPTLLKGPTNLVIIENEDASFTATIDGKPEPKVQWLKLGREIKSSEQFNLTKRDQTYLLTIKNAQLDDGGQYTVRAVNDAGELTATARLTVNIRTIKPTLLKGPTDLVIIENEDASFTATIDGKPEPKVQWLKLGREIKPSEHFVLAKNDQTHWLTIKNAHFDDGGQYSVRAVNDAGELTATAKLTVNMRTIKPTLLKGPADLVVIENEDASFTATIDGKPEPRLQWFKNGVEIQPSGKSFLAKRGQVYWLTIKNAQLDDGGHYSVRAVNDAGEFTAAAKLTVMEKLWAPFFTKKLSDKALIELEQISFTCTINAKPIPSTIIWIKNGKTLTDGSRIKIDSVKEKENEVKVSLKLNEAEMSDAGQYTVIARNSEGEATNSATLTVIVRTVKPNLLKGPSDLVITEHEDAIFSATIDGKPEPRVQWLKNDWEIKPSERFVLAKKDQTHWLTIKNAHLDDGGQYSVRSVNDAGELTATAKLTVNEKLWAPFFTKKMIDKSLNEQDTVFFECTVSAKPLPSLTWFKEGMELRESSRIKIVTARGGENEMKLSFTLTDAVLSDSGQFVVRAKNSEGEASCSASLTVTVMTVMPIFLRGLSDLVVIEHEDASFSAAINGKPEPKVQWLKNGREIKPSEVYIMTKKDQTHSLTIKNTRLDDGGQYSVKAVNEGGELVSTAKLTVKEKLWAPVFTKKLIDRSFFEHDPVVLECAVSAKPPPSVIWTKDGKPLREDSRLKFNRVNEGNTDFKLSMTLTDGKLNDSGQYRVVVKNTEGEASNKGHLTVKIRTEKPWLLRGPTNLKIEEESSGSFVAFVDGKPYPEIQWLKDSVPLTIGGRFITKSSGDEQTLIIKEAKRRDAGVYTIKATNKAGELKASATLEVLDLSPYFLDMLKDVMVSEGMSAVFVCKVYPDSAPVVWHTEESEVSPSDTRYKISTKGNERRLEIVRASRHDYGIITASVGELQSNATLTVEASETEIVETRLLWKIVEDEFMRAAAEFQCTRNRDTAIMRIESMSDPSVAVTDRVQSATQRRWVVKKAYISRDGEFRVDRWSVRSHVDYTITEEGLRDASLGRLDRARYSKQTVEFLILLMEPTAESRWLKDGESISPGSKYDMVVGQDGLVHIMVINDVQQSDEGIYTFMVLRQKVEAHITVEGSGPTQVYHSSTSSPGRLLSVKSRREVDTEALMSQLPSEIQKKKIGSKIVMTYDNRQQIETPTSETLQNQLHEFDAKVTGFEEEEVSDEEPEQEEVFGDEGDGAAKPGKERRSSLVLSRASLPQPLSQLSRSGSLSSLSFTGGGRLGGRAKSEILYFAYTESGKDRPKLDF